MTITYLLAEVARRGVVLRAGENGQIHARPVNVLPDDLRLEIRASRAAVLRALTPGPWLPCVKCGRTSGFRIGADDPTVRCPCGERRLDVQFQGEPS